tara:strand:- start:40 stop:189 length:150 start_codon:yes stop_codon:yes gene_type:complete
MSVKPTQPPLWYSDGRSDAPFVKFWAWIESQQNSNNKEKVRAENKYLII